MFALCETKKWSWVKLRNKEILVQGQQVIELIRFGK
jgi:hypothetical protein